MRTLGTVFYGKDGLLFNSWFLLAVNYFATYWNAYHNPVSFALNLLQTNIFVGLLILITNRPTFALLAYLLFYVTMSVASEVVFSFWNRGLELQDFAHFKFDKIDTTIELISEYESLPQTLLLAAILLALFGIYFYRSPKYFTLLKPRLAYCITAICVVITATNLITSPPEWLRRKTEEIYTELQAEITEDIEEDDSPHQPARWIIIKKVNRMIGPVASLMFESIVNGGHLLSLGSVVPQRTSQNYQLVRNMTDEFYNKLAEHEKNRAQNGALPDIVLMLHESTMDITLADYSFDTRFDFSLFSGDKYTKLGGLLGVDTYGGNTWISEYEAISGMPVRLFDGHTDLPYVFVNRTKHSLISELKKIGYETYMVYPIHKSFAQAVSAYRKLGIDHMFDVLDYGYERGSRKWYDVPDSVVGDIVIDCLNKPSDKPKFIFVTTMSNHGPHDQYKYDQLGCKTTLDSLTCGKLNDYFERLKETELDHRVISKALLDRAQPTLFVNFGDHQPSFEGYFPKIRFKKDARIDQYKTFYNLKSNFDLHIADNYSALDLYFLPGLIMDALGFYDSEYFNLNIIMRKECKGSLNNCEASGFGRNLLESYKAYLYDDLGFHSSEYLGQ